jgi:drug/metabolite transporter (DMT)-like permease
MAGRELAKVDPADEPSAAWGWHGEFPRATSIAGVIVAILLPLILLGHPVSWTEILFAVIPAIVILGGVVWLNLRKRRDWRH